MSSVDHVRILEHQEKSPATQQMVTVRFSQPFDHIYQHRLHALAMEPGIRSTMDRHRRITTAPEDIGPRYRSAVRPISPTDDPVAAHQIVKALLKEGEGRAISAHFEEYRVICSPIYRSMGDLMLGRVLLGSLNIPECPAPEFAHSVSGQTSASNLLRSRARCPNDAYPSRGPKPLYCAFHGLDVV